MVTRNRWREAASGLEVADPNVARTTVGALSVLRVVEGLREDRALSLRIHHELLAPSGAVRLEDDFPVLHAMGRALMEQAGTQEEPLMTLVLATHYECRALGARAAATLLETQLRMESSDPTDEFAHLTGPIVAEARHIAGEQTLAQAATHARHYLQAFDREAGLEAVYYRTRPARTDEGLAPAAVDLARSPSADDSIFVASLLHALPMHDPNGHATALGEYESGAMGAMTAAALAIRFSAEAG